MARLAIENPAVLRGYTEADGRSGFATS